MYNTKGHKARKKLEEIKYWLNTGQISYEKAQELAEQPLKELNEAMAIVAKKFGKKPVKVGFIGFMR